MSTFRFPNKASKVWKDERGSQATFTVPDASPLLGRYINSLFPIDGVGEEWAWEVIVDTDEVATNTVTIICGGDILMSQFKRSVAAIAARCCCITTEEFEAFKNRLIRSSMAGNSSDTLAWTGVIDT